ncbi:MAG: hypothetical protein AAGA48_18145 [Myxococcota bacterium]
MARPAGLEDPPESLNVTWTHDGFEASTQPGRAVAVLASIALSMAGVLWLVFVAFSVPHVGLFIAIVLAAVYLFGVGFGIGAALTWPRRMVIRGGSVTLFGSQRVSHPLTAIANVRLRRTLLEIELKDGQIVPFFVQVHDGSGAWLYRALYLAVKEAQAAPAVPASVAAERRRLESLRSGALDKT